VSEENEQLENVPYEAMIGIAKKYYSSWTRGDERFSSLIKVRNLDSTMWFEFAHAFQVENWLVVMTPDSGPWIFSEEESTVESYGRPQKIEYLDEMP
jgi:hypothetical protein